MAKKISQLTQATEVKSDDVTVIVQDGETKKIPLNMMVTKQDIENKKIAGLAKLDEIEATYENDTYTPTITVKNKSSVKVGEGDGVDYSANVMDGHVKSAILKGQTLVNLVGDKREYDSAGTKTLYGWEFMLPYNLTSGKTYLAIFDVYGTIDESNSKVYLMYNGFDSSTGNTTSTVPTFSLGHNVVKCIAINDKHKVLRIRTTYNKNEKFTVSNVMLIEYQEGMENWDIPYFEGMQSVKMPVLTTSNEDGTKTNILTVNEPVELRAVGDVQDELNLLTGELTQRIGEVVLDGSEDEIYELNNQSSGTHTSFAVRHLAGLFKTIHESNTDDLLSDKLQSAPHNIYNKAVESVQNKNTNIYINLSNEKTGGTVDGLKAYLQSNPIKLQYQLATPIIKTVDLIPSGTHPSTTPYCWKNGRIQLSSSGLLPNLEYSVVTSRAGQINQNATMIVKNDKRIFDLEILLAGGLVNTTYQALTLQNQVETGLSKVSLNSETEPDYLLYHMIMKLIEEKAYKLDDLTEKVSVFYLYEKLSDEQFETIYSALYPFVEDEIVEEPVVEELPEVVEDEVIM